MRREYKTLGFRCYDLEMYDRIVEAAYVRGLSVGQYIQQIVINVVDGNVPDVSRINKFKIDVMRELQTVKDQHPQVNLSGIERMCEAL
ncbi:hypothetical protein [Enterocloster lavalensis]|uniref:hypothetical protein n=1 Tax=Enterocloster lavalensis TaxID=460384 RepID=UPI0026657E15|nr:hypothetical protein [Enterocloster lavalensis]